MTGAVNRRSLTTIAAAVGVAAALTTATQTTGQVRTAVPVVFSHGIDASHAHSGDGVTVKTMQKVLLPDRTEMPKGTTVEGRVTTAEPFLFNPAPYASQRPSVLGLRFDRIMMPHGPMQIFASVRALADWVDSEDAARGRAMDEHDTIRTVFMIGGGSYRGDAKSVKDEDGNVIAYIRRDGVFARLLDSQYANRYSRIDCPGSGDTEESVGIFSPRACGLYGMRDVYLSNSGLDGGSEALRLESHGHTVKISARSTALLQIAVSETNPR